MATIAITGIGGLIGRRLAAALATRDDVDAIVGVDVVAPAGLELPGVRFVRADVRDPTIATAFTGCDVVIHLAFQLDAIRDEAAMRAINVEGTRTVMVAAREAGVGHLVYPSSVVAYGAHPDNDVPLTEHSPRHGTPGFAYAEHKRDVEAWLWPWAAEHPELDVCVLRPAAVLGPGVQNFISRTFEAPRLTAVKGHRPPLQFVHLDDVVSALVHAVEQRLTGAFNVSATGWLSFDEITAIVDRKVVAVPEEVAFATTDRLWRLGLGDSPAGIVNHLMYPWVMSSEKLKATGWRPVHSNRDALASTVAEHAGWVVLGRARLRRRTLGAAGVGAVVVAAAAASVARRGRRR